MSHRAVLCRRIRFLSLMVLFVVCVPLAHATSGTMEGWNYEGSAEGLPGALAGPFLSTYDGVVFAELGPNGEAVWNKNLTGRGRLSKQLEVPPLAEEGDRVMLTFWYDWVAVMEDGVPPGGMDIFLNGELRLRLAPTPGYIDPMVQWDVTEYAGQTIPLAIEYWYRIISHGAGPTTGFWAEFIGVSFNMLYAQGQESNTSDHISGSAKLVMRNDYGDIKAGDQIDIDVFGEVSGAVWFVPIVDPVLRIPHQDNGAYSARIQLEPWTRYRVTEQYQIGLTSVGMVGTLHPVADNYVYVTRKRDHQFTVTWSLANISVSLSGDVSGHRSELAANWLRIKAEAERDIPLGEPIIAQVQYDATWVKSSSVK